MASSHKGITTHNPYNITVTTPTGTYPSFCAAGRAEGFLQSTIRYRCEQGQKQRDGIPVSAKSDYRGYVVVGSDNVRPKYRRVHTPHGEFDKLCDAASAEDVTPAAIVHKIQNPKRCDYYYID